MADQGGINTVIRDYRKGNWTLGETMVLIEAKKMDDERRMKRITDNEGGLGGIRSTKPAELRWKWVEDYCWRKGCFRSQNQCNDKWDNLMRDYKKVRDYERRLAQEQGGLINTANEGKLGQLSYWKMEKNERKDKNLPSNMLLQIYEALFDVVERKSGGGQRLISSNPAINVDYGVEKLNVSNPSGGVSNPAALVVAPLMQHQVSVSIPLLAPSPAPPPTVAPPSQAQAQPQALPPLVYSQPLPAAVVSDTDETSEYSDTPAKRRRRRKAIDGGDQERSSGSGGATGSATLEMGSAISRSASIIAEAIQACEDRKERRHRDLLNLQERRLQLEESNAQINRQSINSLVDAITNLASSILALASRKKS